MGTVYDYKEHRDKVQQIRENEQGIFNRPKGLTKQGLFAMAAGSIGSWAVIAGAVMYLTDTSPEEVVKGMSYATHSVICAPILKAPENLCPRGHK